MDKKKALKKLFRFCITVSFVIFISLYFSNTTGFIEYQNKRKTALTEKQIKEFEKDVKEGKQIDLKDYLENTDYNYQNKLSGLGLKISNTTGKGVKIVVEKSFKFLEKLTE